MWWKLISYNELPYQYFLCELNGERSLEVYLLGSDLVLIMDFIVVLGEYHLWTGMYLSHQLKNFQNMETPMNKGLENSKLKCYYKKKLDPQIDKNIPEKRGKYILTKF